MRYKINHATAPLSLFKIPSPRSSYPPYSSAMWLAIYWNSFTSRERKNMFIYIVGIMFVSHLHPPYSQ